MTYRRWIQIALGYLAVQSITLGAWATFAPQHFYDTFPGFGRTWISIDGPFNEHLVRDVGALNLALAVLLVAAIRTVSRELVTVAAIASLAWGLPHFVYHLLNTDGLDGADIPANVGGLGLFAAIPVALLVLIGKAEAEAA